MRRHLLVRLYPRRWRAHYQDEMEALLEQRRASIRDGLDLFWGALEAHLRSSRGGVMEQPEPTRGSAIVAAALLFLPAAFLFSVAMKYGLTYDRPFDSLEGFWTFKPVEYLTVLSPLAALIVSAVPALRASMSREGAGLKGSVVIQASLARLAVVGLSLAMLFVFFVYFVTENF